MAPPVRMAPAPALEAAAVPTSIIHGWDDELIPAPQVVDWAQARRARLLLVDDSHRLAGHVEASAEAFAALLAGRSEEHTSELQSLMRISYAGFCLKKKNTGETKQTT